MRPLEDDRFDLDARGRPSDCSGDPLDPLAPLDLACSWVEDCVPARAELMEGKPSEAVI